MEAGRDTGDRTGVLGRFLHAGKSLFNDRVNLRHIAFLAALCDLEDTGFRLLHQVLDVLRLVEGFLFYLCRHGNQVTCSGFLRDDLCVIAEVGCRCHTTCQLCQIHGTACFLQRALRFHLLAYRHQVNWQVFGCQFTNGFEHHPVLVFIEHLRTQQVRYCSVRLFLQHQRTEHGVFQLLCLRG